MGIFNRIKSGAKVAKKFGECRAEHPQAWALGEELADGVFETRTDYLLDMTKTAEGADKYIRISSEQMLKSLDEGTFEELAGAPFPEPVTDEAATCFGIAFSTRLVDLFESERNQRR